MLKKLNLIFQVGKLLSLDFSMFQTLELDAMIVIKKTLENIHAIEESLF
jgi:hypothetical protein